MIEPPSWNSGSAFCTVNRSPLTLMSNILSKWASEISPNGANSPTPAFANRMSMRPFFSFTVAYNRSRSGRFETSPWTPKCCCCFCRSAWLLHQVHFGGGRWWKHMHLPLRRTDVPWQRLCRCFRLWWLQLFLQSFSWFLLSCWWDLSSWELNNIFLIWLATSNIVPMMRNTPGLTRKTIPASISSSYLFIHKCCCGRWCHKVCIRLNIIHQTRTRKT